MTHEPPDVSQLVELFYESCDSMAQLDEVESGNLPPAYASLLDHDDHMTVTVEAFHGSLVDVEVIDEKQLESGYCRKIVLVCQSNRRPVQFGIVRLDWNHFAPEVRREIEQKGTPLGRVLIKHNVHRRVELCRLFCVHPQEDLAGLLAMPPREPTYGRTARILVAGRPAIELLEIVAPVS